MQFGVPKMCDFGWAVYDPQDHRTSNIGTLLYLSPENVKG
jgi:serine/threonine protein kinase